jgi:hypothetical protein
MCWSFSLWLLVLDLKDYFTAMDSSILIICFKLEHEEWLFIAAIYSLISIELYDKSALEQAIFLLILKDL